MNFEKFIQVEKRGSQQEMTYNKFRKIKIS